MRPVVIACVICVTFAGRALASPEDDEKLRVVEQQMFLERQAREARALYDDAVAAYKLQHYDQALHLFERAYGERKMPSYLFNIGQCYRQMADFERAARAFRTYLHDVPAAKNQAEVERWITEMDAAAARSHEGEGAQPAPATAPPRLDVVVTPPAAPAVSPPAAVVAAPVAVDVAVSPPRARPWYRRPLGLSLGIIGVAVTATGGTLLGVSVKESSDAGHAASLADYRRLEHDSRSLNVAGWPVLSVGLAAVVAGGITMALKR